MIEDSRISRIIFGQDLLHLLETTFDPPALTRFRNDELSSFFEKVYRNHLDIK